MGYIMHDAIVVTAFRKTDAIEARNFALMRPLPASELVGSFVNDYWTFVIGPDGSKEGWSASDVGDKGRAEWLAWAREAHKRGVFLSWVHVRFGDSPSYVSGSSNEENEP